MVERVRISKEATDANVDQDFLADIARSVGSFKILKWRLSCLYPKMSFMFFSEKRSKSNKVKATIWKYNLFISFF